MARKHSLQALKSLGKVHSVIPELVNQYRKKEISRREFLAHSTGMGLSAALAYSVVGYAPKAQAMVKKGGTLRIGMKLQELKDPQNFEWIESSNVARGMVEYLTRYTDDAAVKGYLAESWKVSEDGKTFDLFLRKGVKWSNGDDFTAEDVMHNFNRWRAPDSQSINKSEWGDSVVSDVERVNDHQVRLHLAQRDATVAHRLFAYPTCIVHRSFDDTGADLVKNPIGTGPFELKSFRVGEGALMTRKKGYWEGDAYLDGVQIVDLGSDEQASVSALAAKQIDWIFKVSPRQLDILEKLPGVKINGVDTAQTPVIRFRVDQAPYDNPKLREAISLAADNAAILRLSYRDNGAVAENHHTAPFQPDYYDMGNRPQQNLQRARQLIEEVGMQGQEIPVTVGNTQGTYEQDVLQVLQSQCAQAGINLKLNVLPTAQYWEVWDSNPFGLTFWTHRPIAMMLHKLAYHSEAKWNETGFKNARYDDALAKALASPDPVAAREHMRVCQQLLRDNYMMVQPFWLKIFNAGDEKVQDFPVHQQEYFPLHRVWMA